MELINEELTRKIIQCAYSVHNELGAGFVEKIYENAMAIELEAIGMVVAKQIPIIVFYKKNAIGNFYADLFVENEIVVEVKAINEIKKEHEVQLVNYLTATKNEIGLLINFGPSVAVKRKYRKYKDRNTT